jgi:AraC-like DNA-binding protein
VLGHDEVRNVGRRDGLGIGGKARKEVSILPPARLAFRPVHRAWRVVITTHLDAAELGKNALKATLPLRILGYARTHLHDPHLGASGITLADWIRKQRLERCRNDIAASAFHATPIASIARGWGFTDPSSFTRMFKNAYGMSPREWSHQANTRRSEPTGEFINQ